MRRPILLAVSIVATSLCASAASAQLVGPSTTQTPYVIPVASGVITKSIISNGGGTGTKNGVQVPDETYGTNNYRLVGIPDGLGAYDNNDGTFTLLVNHEIGATQGVTRAHGAIGSFVSKWTISKSNLAVNSGTDFITSIANIPGAAAPFGRFCSSDLAQPSAYFNAATGLGTSERIYMTGEEVGNQGRAYGTIVSSGVAHYLPQLGKMSWENALASPFAQNKTVVMNMDDSTPGQVYMYVGNKTNSANPIDAAGLNNGKLYGLKGSVFNETTASPVTGAASFVDLSVFQAGDGNVLNTQSNTQQVTNFARPEDGVWNPAKPNEFYWVNTGTSAARSRLYRMTFTDIANPELGGNVEMLMDSTDGPQAMDNMTLVNSPDGKTRILVQEDGGTGPDDIWLYNVTDDSTLKVATHDSAYSFANDSESSGIIPAFDLLGDGWFIYDTQAAHTISANGLVAGGQIQAIFIPQTIPEPTTLAALGLASLVAIRRRK